MGAGLTTFSSEPPTWTDGSDSGLDVPDFEPEALAEVDIVVVDDERTSLAFLSATVSRIGHPVRSFSDPTLALRSIADGPPHVLVTDMVMPGMSGVDLAREARRIDPDIEVILISGYGDDSTAAGASGLGVSTYLSKPIGTDVLSRALQKALVTRGMKTYRRAMVNWMYTAMARHAEELKEVTLGTLEALMNAMDARSRHFKGHSRAVALHAAGVAQSLGLEDDEIEEVRAAGLIHDIGMIGVPDSIVDKPDALTDEERDLVRKHCWLGATILGPMKHLGPATLFVLDHHERWDGSGYPNGKKGDEISLGGQIVGIAEAWTGFVEARPYRQGHSQAEGVEMLREHEGRWFSEDLTSALIESDIGVIG